MTNLRKNFLVAGCVCLSFTLFSFTSTNSTEGSIGEAQILNQSETSFIGGSNVAAKTGKIAKKVWNNTCQVVFWEAVDFATSIFDKQSTNSDNNEAEKNYKLNQL